MLKRRLNRNDLSPFPTEVQTSKLRPLHVTMIPNKSAASPKTPDTVNNNPVIKEEPTIDSEKDSEQNSLHEE